jgi:hypothetical protein
MTAVSLDDRGHTVVVPYEIDNILRGGVTATETFIQQERTNRRNGHALAEAILHRGPTAQFWNNVRELMQLVERWRLQRSSANAHLSTYYFDQSISLKRTAYPQLKPDVLLIPYLGPSYLAQEPAPPPELALLTRIYADGTERASSAGLSALLDHLLSDQSHRQIEDIDSLLMAADLSRLAPEYIVGLLRINFPFRNALPAWNDYLNSAKKEISARDIKEIEKIFDGLDLV